MPKLSYLDIFFTSLNFPGKEIVGFLLLRRIVMRSVQGPKEIGMKASPLPRVWLTHLILACGFSAYKID